MTQSERFDPKGKYIRRWIPQLSRLALPWIHEPWAAPASVPQQAEIELGKDDPRPVVDHQIARRDALEAFEKVRRARIRKD